jgi:UDP-N-acetylglucosamine--N-acetylmuramyl-(pentapeptide) pyrophosphoryl-undecaprenol N-acetylglucosamine transferase
MKPSQFIVLSAGGTGGHLFPAQAVMTQFIEQGHRVVLCTEKRCENYIDTFPETWVIPAKPIGAGRKSFGSLTALAKGFFIVLKKFIKNRPDCVVGFGGYASTPATVAAVCLRIPVVIHEQNAFFGKANRFLAPFAKAIALSTEPTAGLSSRYKHKFYNTGMPVRPAFIPTPFPAHESANPIHILVLGGSLGAKILSAIVPLAIGRLPTNIRQHLFITHQARPDDQAAVKKLYDQANLKGYRVTSFIDDMAQTLDQTHLFIGRSGAGILAELTHVGRPGIFIPYPHATDNHQLFNAQVLEDAGAGWVMTQAAFTPQTLALKLETLLEQPETLVKYAGAARSLARDSATDDLVQCILKQIK